MNQSMIDNQKAKSNVLRYNNGDASYLSNSPKPVVDDYSPYN